MANTPSAPHSDLKNALWGNLFIFLSTVFFGLNFPAVKYLVPRWADANDVSLFRLAGGCVLFWVASMFVRRGPLARADRTRVLLGGGLGLFAFMFLFNLALGYGNPIDISIIMTLPPIMVIIISMLFRHYRPSWLELGGVLISLAGATIVIVCGHTAERGNNDLIGNILAVASALSYAIYLVVLEGPSHTYRPITLMRWVFLAAAVPALLFIPGMVHSPLYTPAAGIDQWLVVAFIVLGPTFVAYLLINPAEKLVGSEVVSLYQYLLPVIATVASVAFGMAHLRVVQVLAMVVIVAGMYLTVRGKRRHVKA